MIQAECGNCGKDREPRDGARGWCQKCYRRWTRAGRPETGPPDPQFARDLKGHLEDYRQLVFSGVTEVDVLAQRIGVSVRTVKRYRRMESKTGRLPVPDSKSGGW